VTRPFASRGGAQPAYILFGLGDRTLALPLSAVEAVERPGRFTEVPFAAPWLRGVTAVRGAVLSVVDLGRFAGGAPSGLTPSARLLVTRSGAVRTALLVDRVGAICDTLAEPQSTSELTGPLMTTWRGVLPHEGGLIPVIDQDKLMCSTEFNHYQESGAE
jgi:purine-binding chemotaxis protein CheW